MVDEPANQVATRPGLTRRKKIAFSSARLLLAIVLCLIIIEDVLRICGIEPWQYRRDTVRTAIHQPDPELGWTNKEARYELPAFEEGEPDFVVTNWSDGRRATAPVEASTGRPVLATVGCSFTQGWAISDCEAYPWRLQQRFPSVEVRNYGTCGFGTYQSLLTLEREFRRGLRPHLVLYGLIPEHERRNVAPSDWLKALSKFSNRSQVDVPFCTIDAADRIVRHEPERFLCLPLRESLVTIAATSDLVMKLKTRGRSRQARRVTEMLLQEMNELCLKHGADFKVVMLAGEEEFRRHYESTCREQRIGFLECESIPFTPEFQVRGDGHPNGEVHRRWAATIAASLEQQVKRMETEHPAHQ